MPKKTVVFAVAALAGLAIAACGGDDESATTSSDDAAGSEDFVAEVTAACDAAGAELAQSQEALQGAVLNGEGDLVALVQDELVPVYDGLISDLEAITPPEDQADTYDQLISNLNESVDLLENNAEDVFAAASGEQNDITEQVDQLEAESDQLAAELGVPENCGEGETTGATGAEETG
ncbi:MAG TPA: hypothetical protein VFY99_05465 [Solirubrobacterales bacterium]